MASRTWLKLGGTEIANSRRAATYFETAECASSLSVVRDDSWLDLHRYLQEEAPYSTPAADGAPWYDEGSPASAEFLGVWVLGLDGLDSAPMSRTVIASAGAGGGFAAPRWGVREINVEAVLAGSSPAGLEYGIEWLNSALVQDQCEEIGEERVLRFLAAAPYIPWEATDEEVRAAGYEQERWVGDVVVTSPVSVVSRFGRWDPDPRQTIAARVQFTLSAGNPFVWKARRSLVTPTPLSSGAPMTVTFERVDEEGNWSGTCPDPAEPLFDPALPAPVHLPRPMTPTSAVGTMPFASLRSMITVPASAVRPWETMVPTVVIQAGAKDERSVRIQWVRGTDVSDISCASIGEAVIGYIPAGALLTLDGVTGRATVIRAGSSVEQDATSVVTGRNGAPWRPPVMRCGEEHTLVVDAPTSVHTGTIVAASGAVRMN